MEKFVILFIVTSQALMPGTTTPTGVWLEELTTPYYAFVDQGHEVEVVSVSGGEIPIDPRSLGEDSQKEESVIRYNKDEGLQALIKNTRAAKDVDIHKYDAVFFPGGHGTMWDYPDNPDLKPIIETALALNKPVAAVCHGPAVLVGVETADGTPLVRGRKISAFLDSEEEAVGLTNEVPFLLETRLRELGAEIVKAEDFQPIATVDGLLVTGQNPASAKPVAEEVIKLLEK